jgi:hypothetical protein
MKQLNSISLTRLFACSLALLLIATQSLPNGSFMAEAGKGKGKGKGGNIIISTSGGGGGGYSYPIPIPIPIHCDGGKSYWRRRRR